MVLQEVEFLIFLLLPWTLYNSVALMWSYNVNSVWLSSEKDAYDIEL